MRGTGSKGGKTVQPLPVMFEIGQWMDTRNEDHRIYVFPSSEYRIDRPQRVLVKRKPEGDSHRVISHDENGKPISHYVAAGWVAIRWEGLDGQEAFDW